MPFWFRTAPEAASVESLVIRAHDLRPFRALYWVRTAHAPKVGVVVMHPRVDFTQHYAIPRLVAAGFGVLAATTRHAGNDTLAEHEEMVLDVAACVQHLREQRGVERVVLFGNCGGASLAAFYQAQARLPAAERLAATPGGSPTHFAGAPMTPADGVVFVAAHRGQGKILQDSIDPSVVDERDPLSVDPALDMYDQENGFRAPPAWNAYDPAFIARYRAAQVARVARLDELARAHLARRADPAASEREQVCEPIMVVYRTMANPACVDRSIDPSDRDYGSLLSERPDLMNYAALGLARTCSPRAWLSTWSGLSSNADLVANAARIPEPALVVHAGRDREVFPSDREALAVALGAGDRTVVTIDGARHYFEPEPGEKAAPHVEALMDVVVPWIRDRFA
jgi:dienelactone hydrolase